MKKVVVHHQNIRPRYSSPLYSSLYEAGAALSSHTSELVVRIILFMSHFSIFDTRYIFGLANLG